MKKFNFSGNLEFNQHLSNSPAELRIRKDLIEMKRNRITTKLFDVKLSNVYKDSMNEVRYNMLVSMECKESKISYEVISFINNNFIVLYVVQFRLSVFSSRNKNIKANFSKFKYIVTKQLESSSIV